MGKTTTVRSILGLTRARGGSVRFLGERIDQLPADRIARMGMAVVSEPLEADEGGWTEVPTATFCTFEDDRVKVEDFHPCRLAAAAA